MNQTLITKSQPHEREREQSKHDKKRVVWVCGSQRFEQRAGILGNPKEESAPLPTNGR